MSYDPIVKQWELKVRIWVLKCGEAKIAPPPLPCRSCYGNIPDMCGLRYQELSRYSMVPKLPPCRMHICARSVPRAAAGPCHRPAHRAGDRFMMPRRAINTNSCGEGRGRIYCLQQRVLITSTLNWVSWVTRIVTQFYHSSLHMR